MQHHKQHTRSVIVSCFLLAPQKRKPPTWHNFEWPGQIGVTLVKLQLLATSATTFCQHMT
eukprot:2808861-Amphidinium_carterae.1